MNDNQTIDFTTLLASAAHDMKNSLAVILTTIDEISDDYNNSQQLDKPLNRLRIEANDVNNDLMSLLSLYKLENRQITPSHDLNTVYDFLEEQLLSNKTSLCYNNIIGSIDCDEMIQWVFDTDLLGIVISNIINNALRYGRQKIKLSAVINNQILLISIEDDGPGYPSKLLKIQPGKQANINSKNGNTGLGLYFSETIARSHHNSAQHGHIKLNNQGSLGGACFTITIPKL